MGRKISLQTIEESISHAIVKARGDVNVVLQSLGYQALVFGSTSPIGFWRVMMRHFNIMSLKWKVRSDDVVFIQFPWIHHNKKEFYNNLFNSGARVECVIHDLDSFRYGAQDDHYDELEQLNRCNSIIAHTPSMKEYLVRHGVDEEKIKILYFFPYLTQDPLHQLTVEAAPTIIFAGNLEKSPFVNDLNKIASEKLKFNLYGKGAESFSASTNVSYKGIFEPNHPGGIEGNWGLVWDGPELATCSGAYGNYLKYNSSHKISLYLSLGIPVILWKESSLCEYVLEHNLGICVESLFDLEKTLRSLTLNKRKAILDSVRQYALQIRTGETLSKLIAK